MDSHFDLVIVGSGFGSLFFIHKYLKKFPNHRACVIEMGEIKDHHWQVENNLNFENRDAYIHDNTESTKPWLYTIGWGGGTNCWWGQTPRLLPSDFELFKRYGVGRDWPITYQDLEEFYVEAEYIMNISGSSEYARVAPRSAPYPIPAHLVSEIDDVMMANTGLHFPAPTARASISLSTRNKCCASSRCGICPIDAKFTANNGFANLLEDQRIEKLFNTTVLEILHTGSIASGVLAFNKDKKLIKITADLVVIGANAINSVGLLLRSNIKNPKTGLGICEQVGFDYEVTVDKFDNFGGSTVTTGVNYELYDGDHRKTAAAALIYFENFPKHGLRLEPGKWRKTIPLTVIFEDLPQDANFVALNTHLKPKVVYTGHSTYVDAGLTVFERNISEVLRHLPVESIRKVRKRDTEAHIQCTLRFGNDANNSVVDKNLIHHSVRNLLIVGTSVFPTCPPANPSLTAAALSLRSASYL